MRNWAGNVAYSTAEVRAPATVEELQTLVGSAARVRALGERHSFSEVVDTPGVLVSTSGLEVALEIDEIRKVAWLPASATYAQFAPMLTKAGWALQNMASLPHVSVAGACATGTHGSGIRNACLATQIVETELVTGTGELLTARHGDPEFPGLVLALGSLGVTTRVGVRIERSYDVCQEVLLDVPVDSAVNSALDILSAAYSVSMFTSFKRGPVIDSVWLKSRGPEYWEPDSLWGGRRASRRVHPIVALDARAATDQLGTTGPWHERLPHFKASFTPSAGDELQSEFFLPREAASDVLCALAGRAEEFAAALQVMEIRTVAADALWLSPFQGRDTLAVHATWISDVQRVRPALERLENILQGFEPRPHWAKVFLDFDRDWVESTYPGVKRFRELAARLDPERRFINAFVTGLGIR